MATPPHRSSATSAIIVASAFALALAALALTHGADHATYRLSKAAAVRGALADPDVQETLRAYGPFDHTRVSGIDSELQRVSLFRGHQLIADVAVRGDGSVRAQAAHPPGRLPSGNALATSPLVLALLVGVFALCTITLPAVSLRNLDVLALVSFLLTILLFAHRLTDASVYAAYPPLLYLGVRCLQLGLGRGPIRLAGTPLLDRLTAAWAEGRLSRILVMALAAAALIVAMLTISSTGIEDVGIASMLGATRLLDGRLPYGQLPAFVVHGDTYPLLNYVAHIPAATVLPVRDAFDDFDGALYTALVATLVVAAALYRTRRRGPAGSREAGLRVALAWLTFPPVTIAASAGRNDMLLAACVALALCAAVHSGRSTLALAIAGWVKLIPLLILPLWLTRFRGRALARALAGAAGVSAAATLALLALGGAGGPADMVRAVSFQFQRGSQLSIWTLANVPTAQMVFQAAVLALLALMAWRVVTDRALAGDLPRIAALVGAVMIGVQLSASYWTFAYLPWLFPPLALSLLSEPPGSPALRTYVSPRVRRAAGLPGAST